MAIHITSDCINCGACEPECPNNAIYEGGVAWAFADGTTVKGMVTMLDGATMDADQKNPPISDDIYYIVPGKCTECKGFHDEPLRGQRHGQRSIRLNRAYRAIYVISSDGSI